MRLIDKDKLIDEVTERHYSHASMRLLREQPEVKAIPIEYIKAFKEEVRDVTNGKAVIDWLLEEWGKENDTNI